MYRISFFGGEGGSGGVGGGELRFPTPDQVFPYRVMDCTTNTHVYFALVSHFPEF